MENQYDKILEYYRLYHWRQFMYKKKCEEDGTPVGCQEISDEINDRILQGMKIEGKL